MAKKSYDQRLKERWLRKQKGEQAKWDSRRYNGFPGGARMMAGMATILSLLFKKRNR